MNKRAAVRLLRSFSSQLSEEPWYRRVRPHVKAMVLYGSVAKGTNRPDSDVDVLLIVPLRIEEKYTCGEYSYYHKGVEVNIVLRSIERLRRLAKQPTAFEAEVFRGCEIIDEKDGEVRRLVAELVGSQRLVKNR